MGWFGQKKKETSLDITDPHSTEGHCFISGNVHIQGEVQFGGTLRIDGRIDGKVSVYNGKKGTLILSKGAYINGPVHTTDLVSDGTIQGDVMVANRLECRSHSVIQGEVQYGSIQIVEGAQLIGRCTQKGSSRAKIEEVATAARQVQDAKKSGDTSLATAEISLATKK